MNRLMKTLLQLLKGLSVAVTRFPFTVLCLVATTAIICYTIYLPVEAPLLIMKWVFTLAVGALLGMVAQFAMERFNSLASRRVLVYGVVILLTAAYFAILWPAPEISAEVGVRTFIAVFAMLCIVLWLPSFKGKGDLENADFNNTSLVHFKSFFTSLLFSAVMSAGISAIIFAIDTLLTPVYYNSYAYVMAIVWILFAPVFYLSLLPTFNPRSQEEKMQMLEKSHYPRFFEILICYIAIPLFTAYTLVLLAYFIKILITSVWPSGQIGPMVLIYSAVGLILFVLASLPENRFAALFRMIFPKVWIPVVAMQLVSVWIRLDAYGVTESRYYVALFGIFSILSGVILSIWPVKKNAVIALLAAIFAIASIIPPVDAFSISRNSQIQRIEDYLMVEGILSEDGTLTPNPNASENSKKEITSIIAYLDHSSSMEYIPWLPDDFLFYRDMKKVFGFDPSYMEYPRKGTENYLYASLNSEIPLDISGYDIWSVVHRYRYSSDNDELEQPIVLNGVQYNLVSTSLPGADMRVGLETLDGTELIGVNLLAPAMDIAAGPATEFKEMSSPEEMTYVVESNGYKIKVVFMNISRRLVLV